MPASLPGATLAENQANPSQGTGVGFDPLSGPKASPLDARKIASWSAGAPVYAADILNVTTGGLNTGIGFGGILNAKNLADKNFTDDYTPGQSLPSAAAAANASIMFIGGGRSLANGTPNPYLIGEVGLCAAGNGGSRDGGTTPFTGFPTKLVTAVGSVAVGAAVEAGWVNRSSRTIVAGESVFGSSTTPLADVA